MHAIIVIGVTKSPTVVRLLFEGNADEARAMLERGELINGPIWAWNLILLPAGMAFFWNWTETPRAAWKRSSNVMRVVVAVFLLSPLTYYFGWLHPYLANCLFSGNTIKANARTASDRVKDLCDGTDTFAGYRDLGEFVHRELRIPMPAAERAYVRYFDKTASRGDELILDYPATMAWFTGVSKKNIEFGGGVWINDQRQGPWTFYDDDGNITEQGEFLDNELHGLWTFYDNDGTGRTLRFEKGKLKQ
ncbi:MAG: hypothetical protein QM811_28420 [Pirellulales bacterium]